VRVLNTNVNPVDLLRQASDVFQEVVANVSPDQMSLPTVNDDWDVRGVINHLVAGNEWMAESLRTTDSVPRPSGDAIGERTPLDAYTESATAMFAAFEQPGALGRMIQMPFGEIPAGGLAMIRFGDLLSHAWDVAKATGQSTDLAPELCDMALVAMRERLEGRDRANMPFKEIVVVPDEACSADRLAGYLGKQM
jgi:uncharacterized protein (TIGR03086 family)